MKTPAQPPQPPIGSPFTEVTQEVRFAVVMYGGVSLCIYINGVAQELLELSRVTAFGNDGNLLHEPKGAGHVYRRIARYLDSDTLDSRLLESESDAKIRTRFIVDVLSGTSAGGLNSLFLAKALANDQGMEGLKHLWMEEADITRLLNDRESVRNEDGLTYPSEPASLLNSQRMYKKLLKAFDQMDFASSNPEEASLGKEPECRWSPHVNDLDCYITATDLDGLPIELKLHNTIATEQRYRNVFHFRYRGPDRNDFVSRNNPFLAFAGRCTAAFPFAFEPMRLADIDDILSCWPRYNLTEADRDDLRQKWTRFYRDYVNAGINFDARSFGDGGYLDNKPFSYATRALMRRRAVLPVRRKLIYVEPSPESRKPIKGSTGKPDFISNSIAALVSLPRYETIREDIQTILQRNKLLETVSRLTVDVPKDVALRNGNSQGQTGVQQPYERLGLSERIKRDGVGYGTYHRLRVIAVTRTLANIVARASGFNVDSDECQAIRWIIEQWRDATFDEEPEQGAKPFGKDGDAFPAPGQKRPRSSQNSFLSAFDIDYRLRRIFFLQRRIGELLHARSPLSKSAPPDGLHEDNLVASFTPLVDDASKQKAFHQELRRIKAKLSEPLGDLLNAEAELYQASELSDRLAKSLLGPTFAEKTKIQRRQGARKILLLILKNPEEATAIYKEHEQEFDAIARRIADVFEEFFAAARSKIDAILPRLAPGQPIAKATTPTEAAQAALLPIWTQFDDYDSVIFPIQYGTAATEANRVDIIRISPPDAKQLINELEDAKRRRKLAGTAVFSFGAFLARFWRENDMLWGRLDAAEVLIRTLLQDTPAAKTHGLIDRLVEEAQRTVLSETLTLEQRQQLWGFICDAFSASSKSRGQTPQSADQIRASVGDLLAEFPDLDQRLRIVLRFAGGEDDEKLREYFQSQYQVRRHLAMAEQLRNVSRAGLIVSRMLNVLAAQRNLSAVKKHLVLLPRVAAIVWGLVEISLPQRFAYTLWQSWRYRFYVVGFVLLVTGLFWQPAVIGGLGIIGLTLLTDIARWWVGDLVRGTGRLKSPLTWALTLFGLTIVVLAGWKAADLWRLFTDQQKTSVATPAKAQTR
jgi:patatin-related protein